MSGREHCIRCLLEEINPEQYEKDIGRLLQLMDQREKAAPDVYGARLDVCRECGYLSKGTCNACGCYVELRAARKDGRCPYKKWRS